MCSAELSWEAANYRARADQENEPACPHGEGNEGKDGEKVRDDRELGGNKKKGTVI